jgi:hypothetical protein
MDEQKLTTIVGIVVWAIFVIMGILAYTTGM